jgi:tRNA-dihydrouridine synthase 2
MIEKTGISAFAVHGRRRDERPQHLNRLDEIREIVRAVNIPVLAK